MGGPPKVEALAVSRVSRQTDRQVGRWMLVQPTQGQEQRLGLGAEVLPTVRPVAQYVVNVGRYMGGHLRQELSGERKVEI